MWGTVPIASPSVENCKNFHSLCDHEKLDLTAQAPASSRLVKIFSLSLATNSSFNSKAQLPLSRLVLVLTQRDAFNIEGCHIVYLFLVSQSIFLALAAYSSRQTRSLINPSIYYANIPTVMGRCQRCQSQPRLSNLSTSALGRHLRGTKCICHLQAKLRERENTACL